MLASHLDEYRFEISRREVLSNIDKNSKITLDLAPFADRQIKIRVWVLAGYNGRGPARSTTSSIIPLHTATDHQNLK
jgi:hypothetical protein